ENLRRPAKLVTVRFRSAPSSHDRINDHGVRVGAWAVAVTRPTITHCCGDRRAGRGYAIGTYSRFLRALFQFSKRAAGEATEFSRSRVELLSVGAARLECGEPAAEPAELIRRQLGNGTGAYRATSTPAQ